LVAEPLFAADLVPVWRLGMPFAQTMPKGEHCYLVYNRARIEEPGF
jgi:hypothetical protein